MNTTSDPLDVPTLCPDSVDAQGQPVASSRHSTPDGNGPSGEVGSATDRDTAGRFVPGNKAALVVGARSVAFWKEHAAARREIRRAVLEDAGYAADADAPRALHLLADGLAQAALVRDSAFLRMVEAGGPLTGSDRVRRVHGVWLSSLDRVLNAVRALQQSNAWRQTQPEATATDIIREYRQQPEDVA